MFNRPSRTKNVLFATLLLGVTSCEHTGVERHIPPTTTGQAAPAPTMTVLNEADAINAAMEIATVAQPEIEAPEAPLSTSKAELLDRTIATQQLRDMGAGHDLPASAPLVWLVTLDGTWRNGFPIPTGQPTPLPYHHYLIVLDAFTGERLLTGCISRRGACCTRVRMRQQHFGHQSCAEVRS